RRRAGEVNLAHHAYAISHRLRRWPRSGTSGCCRARSRSPAAASVASPVVAPPLRAVSLPAAPAPPHRPRARTRARRPACRAHAAREACKPSLLLGRLADDAGRTRLRCGRLQCGRAAGPEERPVPPAAISAIRITTTIYG